MIAANTLKTLNAHKIKAVLTVGTQVHFTLQAKVLGHLHVQVEDSLTANLIQHFPKCFEFIDAHVKENRNVLIHCAAGVSRSATVLIAYLMERKGLALDAAYGCVKLSRP